MKILTDEEIQEILSGDGLEEDYEFSRAEKLENIKQELKQLENVGITDIIQIFEAMDFEVMEMENLNPETKEYKIGIMKK